MLVKVKLKKDRGPFRAGQIVSFDPNSAKVLVADKAGVEVKDDDKAQDPKTGD